MGPASFSCHQDSHTMNVVMHPRYRSSVTIPALLHVSQGSIAWAYGIIDNWPIPGTTHLHTNHRSRLPSRACQQSKSCQSRIAILCKLQCYRLLHGAASVVGYGFTLRVRKFCTTVTHRHPLRRSLRAPSQTTSYTYHTTWGLTFCITFSYLHHSQLRLVTQRLPPWLGTAVGRSTISAVHDACSETHRGTVSDNAQHPYSSTATPGTVPWWG